MWHHLEPGASDAHDHPGATDCATAKCRFRDFAKAMLRFYAAMACVLFILVGAETSLGIFRGLTVSQAMLQLTAADSWPVEPARADQLVRRYSLHSVAPTAQ